MSRRRGAAASQPELYSSAPMCDPDLLSLIADDHVHADDRDLVEQTIREVAANNGGLIDPNKLRRHLSGRIYPAVIGATVSALARSGLIVADGWVINDDVRSRNRGKPARRWRLA